MNKKISGLITDWCSQFISIEAISSVISYGIEVWLNSIVKIILLVLIGGICGFFKETILVLFIFGQVRKYAGGVHCKTDVGCFFSMLFICLISIGVSKNSEKIPLFFIVIVLISIWISTLKYAPCNSKVNPITDEILLEKKRKGAILIITGVSILIIFLPVKEWKWLILCPVFIEVLTILPFMERKGSYMNNIGRVKQVIANLIVKKAVGTAENTVGRSFPQGLHEIEVPNEVKNYLAKKQK